MSRLIDHFTIGGISKKSAIFDEQKLLWMNGVYIRSRQDEELLEDVAEVLQDATLIDKDRTSIDRNFLFQFVRLMKERVKTLREFASIGCYFFRDPERITPDDEDVIVSPADGKVILVEKVFDDRFVNEHVYKITSISDDSFSVKLEGYPLTENFGLYRYEFIDNTPETPSINGPSFGSKGTEYSYNCVTIDPEEDLISYCIDWGDDSEIQWFGPFISGENINISHIWEKAGTYLISVKAKDINDIESGWATLEVSMPNTKSVSEFNSWIMRFIQRFPILEYLI